MYKLASCEYEECPSKDACKRYKNDTAIINFKFYYDENETKNKCEYYIEKERLEEEQNEKEDEKENGKSEQSTKQQE